NLPVTDENIFIVGCFATKGSNKGLEFLKGNYTVNVKKNLPKKEEKMEASISTPVSYGKQLSSTYIVTVSGKKYEVQVEEAGEIKSIEEKPESNIGITEIKSTLPGNILKVLVNDGDSIKQGTPIVLIEVMKMENSILSTHSGKVVEILVKQGDVIQSGQVLMRIKEG
ncbi:MAG: biotin/lipoyl-binding protein, partial [Leptospiraceae bacterium]|nr:biotin/lipoyl-binding protein [Leptospiraceae bacterium]